MAYMSSVEPRPQTASAEKPRQAKRKLSDRQDNKLDLELPGPEFNHWGARSKAAVVVAVRSGVLTLDEACKRYAMSTAEFFSWETAFYTFGLQGLGLAGRQTRRRAMASRHK